LLQGFQFLGEGFLEGLSFFLTLAGSFAPELFPLLTDVLAVLLLGLALCPEAFDLLTGLAVLNFEFVLVLASGLEVFLGLNAVRDCLLVLPEEDVVLDFDIFGLGEAELGDAEVVFQPGDLVLVAVDFADIVLDVVASGRFFVELAFCALGFVGLSPGEVGPISVGRTAGTEVPIRAVSLRHNDNIIQIKLFMQQAQFALKASLEP